jgi:hypothetical protein
MSLLYKYLLTSNIFVSIFGLLGILALSRQKNRFTFPIAMFPLVFPVVYYITHSSLRYRHPIDPAMVVLAALAVTYPVRVLARRWAALTEAQVETVPAPEGSVGS